MMSTSQPAAASACRAARAHSADITATMSAVPVSAGETSAASSTADRSGTP